MVGRWHLFLAAVFFVAAGPGLAPAQDPIRVGAINPYTGPTALYGDELARGYQLAVDEANAKGGVIGRKVELIRGDAATPQQGIAAVDKLVTQDKVDVLVGTYLSAVSNAASDAAARYSKIYWDTNALARRAHRTRLAELHPQRPLCRELRRDVRQGRAGVACSGDR